MSENLNERPRLTQSALVSMNGVIGEPLAWAGRYFGEGSAAHSLKVLDGCEAMLMGRGTYDIFSRQWPKASGPYADRINSIRKYVFSSTLTDPTWENSVVVAGDVVEAVTDLKSRATADLTVYGHGRFGQTLTDAGLVDTLTLTVFPVFVPDGRTFFRPDGAAQVWRLTGAGEGPDPGIAVLTFEPARDRGAEAS
jgi:dihydrofolate reductase